MMDDSWWTNEQLQAMVTNTELRAVLASTYVLDKI